MFRMMYALYEMAFHHLKAIELGQVQARGTFAGFVGVRSRKDVMLIDTSECCRRQETRDEKNAYMMYATRLQTCETKKKSDEPPEPRVDARDRSRFRKVRSGVFESFFEHRTPRLLACQSQISHSPSSTPRTRYPHLHQ